jgi:hypothetical protein
VIVDQFHVTLLVPEDMPDREASAVRKTLSGRRFQAALRRSMRAVVERFPSLAKIRFRVSR